jgi:hypothetical protein
MKFPECCIESILAYLQLVERDHLRSTPLSSYALSPTMLPMLETFLELLLWNSFQWCCHIFWVSLIS